MYLYYNSLLIIMLTAFFLNFLSPTADFSKKFMRPVCGLMLLVVLLSPLPSLSPNADFSFDLSRTAESTSREKFTSDAYTIFAYLSSEYGIEAADTVFITDEGESISEIQIFTAELPYNIKEAIKTDISSAYKCEVRIYTEGSYGKK